MRLPGEGDPVSGEIGPAFIWCDVESLPMWAMLILTAPLRLWGWWAGRHGIKLSSRPGAYCPPWEPVQSYVSPTRRLLCRPWSGVGGGDWDLGAQEEGTYGCQGHAHSAHLPLCWDQRGVVFSCQAPDRLLLEREPVPPCSLSWPRHVLLQT